MAIREIKIYPAPVLKKKAEPVVKITDAERQLIRDMIETLPFAEGVGLAAPQVGVSARIAIAKDVDKDEIIVLINPVIIKKSGTTASEEGCLSLPGLTYNIKRWKGIIVRYLDIEGKSAMLEAKDLLARIIQHEIDHLEGMLIVDRLSFLKRRKALAHYARGHFSLKEAS